MIVLNHKMNLSLQATDLYCETLNLRIARTNYDALIAPAIPYLAYLSHKFPSLRFCAQDVSVHSDYGSYTGEYSASIMHSCNVMYAIIGHDERRRHFGEDNANVVTKINNCLEKKVTPIICIGENAEHRTLGTYKEFIASQLEEIILGIQLNNNQSNILIAYEPSWAIGSQVLISDDLILEALKFIATLLKQSKLESYAKLLYGGSVGANNGDDLSALQKTLHKIRREKLLDIFSGFLLGRTGLNVSKVLEILSIMP